MITLLKGNPDRAFGTYSADRSRLLVFATLLPPPSPRQVVNDTLCAVFSPETKELTQVVHCAAAKTLILPSTPFHDGYLVPVPHIAQGLHIYFFCAKASTAWELAKVASLRKRTLVVPVTTLHANVWYDGYLAHFSNCGEVLSFACQPGNIALSVPHTPRTDKGIAVADVQIPPVEEYRKLCAKEMIAVFCQRRGLSSPLTIAVDDTSLGAAVCVVLASMSFNLHVSKHNLPPPWKRLLENCGVNITTAETASRIQVTELTRFFLTPTTTEIAKNINKRGAIIPLSLMKNMD